MYFDGVSGSYSDNPHNVLSIAGFSVDVPKVLEAFCRERFH